MDNVIQGRFIWHQASLTDTLTCEVRRLLSARHTLTWLEYETQLEALKARAQGAEGPGAEVARLMYAAHHAPGEVPEVLERLLAKYGGDRGYLMTALKALDDAHLTSTRYEGIRKLELLLEE